MVKVGRLRISLAAPWTHRGHNLDTDIKKGPAFSRKSLINMARPIGFEPMTFASGGQRSIQLSYGRIQAHRLPVISSAQSYVGRRDLSSPP